MMAGWRIDGQKQNPYILKKSSKTLFDDSWKEKKQKTTETTTKISSLLVVKYTTSGKGKDST